MSRGYFLTHIKASQFVASLMVLVVLCYFMWNLFTACSLQFCNDSIIASQEANQNRLKIKIYVNKEMFILNVHQNSKQ